MVARSSEIRGFCDWLQIDFVEGYNTESDPEQFSEDILT